MALARLSISRRFSISRFVPKRPFVAVKVAAKLSSRRKKVVWGLRFVRGMGYPQLSDMHFQIALTSEHVAGFG